MSQPDGRSPNRPRQLHDLRLMPTATDPRPMFVWSAEGNRDEPVTHTEYPKLLWHGVTNMEITVTSRTEEEDKRAGGYVSAPVASIVVDPVQSLADQMAGLSEEEQALVMEAQQRNRREALISKLSALSDAQIEQMAASLEPKRGRKAKAS